MVNTVDVMNDCRGSGIAWQWNGVVGLVTTVVGMTLQWNGVARLVTPVDGIIRDGLASEEHIVESIRATCMRHWAFVFL